MKSTLYYSLLALAFAGGAIAISAQGQSPSPSAHPKNIVVEIAFVELIDDVQVPAQEAGRLMKVMVKGGELIEEGAVLAEIDNRDTLAKQKIAEGELKVATEQAKSEAELDVAIKAVEVSKAEYEQSLEIRAKSPGAVSDTELRKYLFQLQRAEAQVKVAQDDRLVASLTTKIKEAQLEATANELARRQITAPFKCEVNDVFRQVGEWVQPGEPIAHIVRFDKVRVQGMIDAKEASPVEILGKPVEITVIAAGNREQKVKGKIDFASSVIDGSGESRTFRVWAAVDNQKLVDPLSKKEAWAIQPGAMARMVIDMTPPPPPKPVKVEAKKGGPAPPATFRPRSALDAAGVKVESLKPVVGEPAAKKSEASKPDEAKPDATKGDTTKPEDKKPEDKPSEPKEKSRER